MKETRISIDRVEKIAYTEYRKIYNVLQEGGYDMTISLRVPDEQHKAIKAYAALHGITMTDLFLQSVLEKIEDEFDLREYEAALAEYKANPVSYSHADVSKMILGD